MDTAFLCYPWRNNICDIVICYTCIYFAEQNQIKCYPSGSAHINFFLKSSIFFVKNEI